MLDGSYAPSNETCHSPQHTLSIPSPPKPPASPTLIKVLPPTAAPPFPLTLIHNYLGPEYLAVSPMSAKTILTLNPTLNATIHTIAFRLATTVQQRTEHYVARLQEAIQRVKQLK